MAEEQDESQKTEEPTQKRLEEAQKKGEVAKSQEIKHWFMIFGGAMVVVIFGTSSAVQLSGLLLPFIESPDQLNMDAGQLAATMTSLIGRVLAILAAPLGLLVLTAIGGNMVQHMPILAGDRIKPKFNRISPLGGFKRLFSAQNTVEFLKSLVKIVIVGSVVFMIVWPERERLGQIMTIGPGDLLQVVRTLSIRMFMGVVAILGFIAAGDFLFQRLQFIKKQRMTKQEVKDEHKQTEGDPMIRSRIRQLRMDRARKRMMAAVPEADVVIVNPTHFAVALKYEAKKMRAPVVVAKGVDNIAFKIREVAEENEIPLYENPPLAQALYKTVDIDQEIPPEHYKAVAKVITYVMGLKRPKAPPRAAQPN
jgi:flagellar biosynthesis protein FlhB